MGLSYRNALHLGIGWPIRTEGKKKEKVEFVREAKMEG